MAPTIIVIVPGQHGGDWPLELLSQLDGRPDTDDPERWFVYKEPAWMDVCKYRHLHLEFEPEEIERTKRTVCEPEFFIAHGRPASLLASYVNLLPNDMGIFVLGEWNWLGNVEAYKAAIGQGVEWLYTRECPLC